MSVGDNNDEIKMNNTSLVDNNININKNNDNIYSTNNQIYSSSILIHNDSNNGFIHLCESALTHSSLRKKDNLYPFNLYQINDQNKRERAKWQCSVCHIKFTRIGPMNRHQNRRNGHLCHRISR